jgi:spectinomycin phosphotransferase
MPMLTPPDISDETIIACLHDAFDLRIAELTFLPLGWVNNAVYRAVAERGAVYFLKLRRGGFDETAVAVPAFLHAHGICQVMAPIATRSNALWIHAHGFDWILYPFFAGATGFATPLSTPQWVAFGETIKAIHTTRVPAALAERMPRETFAPRWRTLVRAFHNQAAQEQYADPIAARLAAFWRTKHDEIAQIVERAEQLAHVLQLRAFEFVVCHADLHAGNLLVGAHDELTIVDWDEPILAPKERDLMFIGGGVGGIWNTEQETHAFYQGYGPTEVDLVVLSYYRYERIVVDIAERAVQIFELQGSVEEREKGLRLIEQFLPNNVVDIAHRTYQQLVESACGE